MPQAVNSSSVVHLIMSLPQCMCRTLQFSKVMIRPSKLDLLFRSSHFPKFACGWAVIIHYLLLAYAIYTWQICGTMKEVCHCLEGNNDSWGSRSQRKWVLMQNNKSSLPGLIVNHPAYWIIVTSPIGRSIVLFLSPDKPSHMISDSWPTVPADEMVRVEVMNVSPMSVRFATTPGREATVRVAPTNVVPWPLIYAPTIVVPTVQVRTPEAVQVYTSLSSKQGLLGSADVHILQSSKWHLQ